MFHVREHAMRRILAGALVSLLLVLTLAACGQVATDQADTTSDPYHVRMSPTTQAGGGGGGGGM
jgi:hypothetical protein